MNIDVYLNSIIMRELKFLNKFLYKYRIKLIVGFFITVAARIFALVAPNLVGNSITLIENYVLSSSVDPYDINRSKSYPVIGFLSKPITKEMLENLKYQIM